MNKVTLVGNLVRDPELKVTTSGISVCTFTIAVSKRVSREAAAQGAKDTADFIPIVVWRGQAENCGKYLSKGKKIAVSGSLSTRTYDAKDGTKRYITEVVADDVEFLTPAGTQEKSYNEQEVPSLGGFHSASSFNEGIQPVQEDELPF